MGDVIAFPQSTDRPHPRAVAQDEPRGVILLFLGVRYERPDGPMDTPDTGTTPRGLGRAERAPRRRKRG
jgi:hypothetical protein